MRIDFPGRPIFIQFIPDSLRGAGSGPAAGCDGRVAVQRERSHGHRRSQTGPADELLVVAAFGEGSVGVVRMVVLVVLDL